MDTIQEQINKLRDDLKALNDEIYLNNFSAHQDFNKASNFTTKLNIPKFPSLPATCEINDIVGVGGILYIASSANTWTLVGSQT
jgi:hypothetical protein